YSDGSGYYHGADGSDGYRYSDGSGYYNSSDGDYYSFDEYDSDDDDDDYDDDDDDYDDEEEDEDEDYYYEEDSSNVSHGEVVIGTLIVFGLVAYLFNKKTRRRKA
uniref:hypothetical protein n=1 Tax=Lachnospira multipara TaxID=28051 RepID=UPI0018CC04E2